MENFLESFSTVVRYVRYSPAIQVVLARNVLFAFFISVIPALIPVIGLKELHWRPDEDLTRSNIYRIEMMVPSWTGYLLQRERLTKAEQETINKVCRLHVGEDVPQERY